MSYFANMISDFCDLRWIGKT